MPLSRRAVGPILVVCVITSLASGASAYAPPGQTTRVSEAPGGLELDGQSGRLDISADGRYVVFGSRATNASDFDGIYQDVFLRDRLTGDLELVTRGYDGSPALGESQLPRMSDDAEVVAFSSSAPNLVEGDTNGATDTFYWVRSSGEIHRASVNSDGEQFDAASQNVEISGNGRFVTFNSRATNAVDNPAAERLIFVHDIATGETETATHTFDGRPPAGSSFFSSISADGRYVAYESFANNITPNDGNRFTDCFVYDRVTGETELVSLTHYGGSADMPVSNVSISGDGRVVAFQTDDALVPDVSGVLNSDIYVRDLETDELERVSVSSKAFDPNGSSTTVQLGHDGRFVLFSSRAVDLAADDRNGNLYDAFIHDRVFDTTELLSESVAGGTGNGHAFGTGLSFDARFAAVYSVASDLVESDTNDEGDSFVRDRGPQTGPFDLRVEGEDTLQVSARARLGSVRLAEAKHPELPLGDVDLRGADASFRPEEGDLYLRLDVGDMQNVQGVIAPGLLYGFDLTMASGRSLQIRARGRRSLVAPADIGLFECEGATCERVASLDGGVGATGSEVVVSIPLALLDGVTGFASAAAWVSVGDTIAGTLPIEELELGPFSLPKTTAHAALTPAGSPVSQTDFLTPLELRDGRLAGSVEAGSLEPGIYDLWARVCVGSECGLDLTSVVVSSDEVELEATEILLSHVKERGDIVVTATLLDASGTPLADRSIAFQIDGQDAGTVVTDAMGAARIAFHRNVVKKGALVTALFEGDQTYSSSLAQTEL